jgi:hypothetical protein
MNNLTKRPLEKLTSLSPMTVCAMGLVYALAVAFVDYATPPRLALAFLYVIGSAFVGWRAGKRQALLVSLVSSTLVIVHDWQANRPAPYLWVTLWNISTRVIMVTAAGWLAAELTRLNRNLGRLVEERTAQCKAEAQRHKTTSESLRLSQRQLAEAMDLAQLANWEYDVPTRLYTPALYRG